MTITGPFSETTINNPVQYKYRLWYRQTPPYRLRLNYEGRRRYLVRWYNDTYKNSHAPGNQSYNPLDAAPTYQPALNMAYEKLKAQATDAAQWAASMGEMRQTMGMMTKRIMQVTNFVKHLRSGNVAAAAKDLGVTWGSKPKRPTASNKKRTDQWNEARRSQRNSQNERKPVSDTFNEAYEGFSGSAGYRKRWPKKPDKNARDFGEWIADTFLEFHFGWIPLVKDIATGLEALTSTFPTYTLRARGSSAMTTGKPKQFQNDPNNGDVYWWRSHVQLICNVEITNPNLWLATQLGVTNPVSVLWELVPFSFVVDWFSNVGSVLGQCTDLLGLDIQNPATTHKVEHTQTNDFWSSFARGEGFVMGHEYVRRSTGLSKPALQLKPFKGFSVSRGVTAIALLLQQLKGVK
jgi:hypothetical protein